jgi:hypothetical protein
MINTQTPIQQEVEPDLENQSETEPDEQGGIVVQGFFRIFEPETGKVITQGRA